MELLSKFKKSEQGSITIFVLSSLLVVLLTMIVIYGGMTNKLSSQAKQIKKIQEEYNQDDSIMDQLYEQNYDIINELQIGDTVTYTPSGTYNWQAEYCSSTKTPGVDDVMLDSSKEEYKISSWRVLDIDKENKQVTLVPEAPTTGTVYLGEAQGYNNGVKLLNDACSSLYGNSSKGIIARSMNIDDIEKYMTPEALTSAHEYKSEAKYGEQSPIEYLNSKYYPSIYAKENLSVIDGNKNTNGLGLSEQTEFIKRNDNGITNGKGYLEAKIGMQPYQTYWEEDKNSIKTVFKIAKNNINYYDLIVPKGEKTTYWIASRCIDTFENHFGFCMRYMYFGGFYIHEHLFSHLGNTTYINDNDCALFPIVSLNSRDITKDATNGYVVE